jgi:predicted GIY-YIG superfamily endonuclease
MWEEWRIYFMGLWENKNNKSFWRCEFCGETNCNKRMGGDESIICKDCWTIYIRKDRSKLEINETLNLLKNRGILSNSIMGEGTIFDIKRIQKKYKKNDKIIRSRQKNKEINKFAKTFHGGKRLIENDVLDFAIDNFKLRGIYFLLDEEENVIYVGQSEFIPSRINEHIRSKKIKFSKVKVKLVPENIKNLLEIESFYIEKYLPKKNTCAKSLRLKREYIIKNKNSIEEMEQ